MYFEKVAVFGAVNQQEHVIELGVLVGVPALVRTPIVPQSMGI
ncbi:MAG: hypothetical protein ABEJ57_01260 [Halobacteriaceae archaeon]